MSAARKAQGSNLACDDLWQTWAGTFAGDEKFFDPAKHETEFLLSFLSHVESVDLTLAKHEELGRQVKQGTIKKFRLDERSLPEDVIKKRSRGAPSSSDRRPLAVVETQTDAVEEEPKEATTMRFAFLPK